MLRPITPAEVVRIEHFASCNARTKCFDQGKDQIMDSMERMMEQAIFNSH